MPTYFITYGAALLLSVPLTVLAVWLGKRLGWTDAPGVRKLHREPVPCIGGLAVYLSVLIIFLGVLPYLDGSGLSFQAARGKIAYVAVAATVIFLLGLADDIKPLRARQKLVVQFVASTLVYYGGIRIEAVAIGHNAPVALGWFAWPVTSLWIVGVTNAVNLSDGVDGLAASISAIACGVLAMLGFWSHQTLLVVLALAMLGTLSGFLCFNFFPARIFLGDSGSLFLGFVIAASSVLCFMESHACAMLAIPGLALGIPIVDTVLTIPRRFMARRPIFAADRGHFHHRLLQRGLGHRQVVGLVCLVTLVLVGISMPMLESSATTSLALFGCATMVLLALFYIAGAIRLRRVLTELQCRFRLGRQTRDEISEFCDLQLQFDLAKSPEAWWQALCRTAKQLDFAWISLDVADVSGHAQTHLWRRPEMPPAQARLTIVKVPLRTTAPHESVRIEAAVLTNGSVEGAIRRASLLGRLIDEYSMPRPDATGTVSLDPMADGIVLKAQVSSLEPRAGISRLDSPGSAPSSDAIPDPRLGPRRIRRAGQARADM